MIHTKRANPPTRRLITIFIIGFSLAPSSSKMIARTRVPKIKAARMRKPIISIIDRFKLKKRAAETAL